MTPLEAMKQALEALEEAACFYIEWGMHDGDTKPDLAITALRAAIEEMEKAEPVTWRWKERNHWFDWTTDWTHHDRAKKLGCPVEYACPDMEK